MAIQWGKEQLTRLGERTGIRRRTELTAEQVHLHASQRAVSEALQVISHNNSTLEGFTIAPSYYLQAPAQLADFEPEGNVILGKMFVRAREQIGQQAADSFVSLVDDIPSLAPTRFLESVYALALNAWQYTPEFATRVKQNGSHFWTEAEKIDIARAYPHLNITVSIPDYSGTMFAPLLREAGVPIDGKEQPLYRTDIDLEA